jgi:predicted amidophosphoribosyltransferase
MAKWMHQSMMPIMQPDMILAPVPLHRWRLLRRRYNQAAVLAQSMAQIGGAEVRHDLLRRIKPTIIQKGMGRVARFANLGRSIIVKKSYRDRLKGHSVMLVDDVMTTGATLSACAEACKQAGAKKVNVVVFARVARPE